jgi:hypothetical protein
MKLIKALSVFIALVACQIMTAQWLEVPPPAEARNLMVVGGGVPVAGGTCSGCSGSNDSILSSSTAAAYSSDDNWEAYHAWQFTVPAGGQCITGIMSNVKDSGNTFTVSHSIYTDSSGSPVSLVSGSSVTTVNIQDDQSNFEFMFSSTQTLAAGTYWVVAHGAGSNIIYGRIATHPDGYTGTFKYSDTGAAESWASNGRENWIVGVIGCTP